MKKKAVKVANAMQQEIRYWEKLHLALNHKRGDDPPKSYPIMSRQIREMEHALHHVPDGMDHLFKAQQTSGLCPEVEISFDVQGTCTQTVSIIDPKMTMEKLQSGLNDGTLITTVQEDGQIQITKSGKVVGIIGNVDMNCTYSDFAVEFQG